MEGGSPIRKEPHQYSQNQGMLTQKGLRLGDCVKPTSRLPAPSLSTSASTQCPHQNSSPRHGTLLMETKDQSILELGGILGIT